VFCSQIVTGPGTSGIFLRLTPDIFVRYTRARCEVISGDYFVTVMPRNFARVHRFVCCVDQNPAASRNSARPSCFVSGEGGVAASVLQRVAR
jgi:hypothetical protein